MATKKTKETRHRWQQVRGARRSRFHTSDCCGADKLTFRALARPIARTLLRVVTFSQWRCSVHRRFEKDKYSSTSHSFVNMSSWFSDLSAQVGDLTHKVQAALPIDKEMLEKLTLTTPEMTAERQVSVMCCLLRCCCCYIHYVPFSLECKHSNTFIQ